MSWYFQPLTASCWTHHSFFSRGVVSHHQHDRTPAEKPELPINTWNLLRLFCFLKSQATHVLIFLFTTWFSFFPSFIISSQTRYLCGEFPLRVIKVCLQCRPSAAVKLYMQLRKQRLETHFKVLALITVPLRFISKSLRLKEAKMTREKANVSLALCWK